MKALGDLGATNVGSLTKAKTVDVAEATIQMFSTSAAAKEGRPLSFTCGHNVGLCR